MVDLIVFNVANNRYALNIDNIQRIIQSEKFTDIPNSHEFIDGMMSYEEGVLKVLNFRKLISLEPHKEDSLDIEDPVQKLIIYGEEGASFAIKVDSIEDITHIDETKIINSDTDEDKNEFLELKGILDLDGVLINIIKTVSLPS